MFKKIASIILCLVLVFSFVGCGKTDSGVESNIATDAPAADPVQSAPEEVTEAPTEETAPPVIDTDENLLTVEITFPASFFEGTDMSTFDADAYAKEQGFISAKVNDDDSLVVTMSKKKHAELLAETATALDTNFATLIEAEDTPYIKEITHNDDFTLVTMKVDRDAYENALDFTPFIIGMSVSYYQMLLDMEYRVEIVTVDTATGDTIASVVYPDVFEE